MAQVRIEMDRGKGWEVRQEGDLAITADALAGQLGAYALQYPHRAFLDSKLIAVAKPVRGKLAGKVERMDTIKPGMRVDVFVGSIGHTVPGTIVRKPRPSKYRAQHPADWHIVAFDEGGQNAVHETGFRVAAEPAADRKA